MKWNKKAGYQIGMVLLLVFFVLVLVLFSLIEPFKEFLHAARGGDQLNCPGTPDFNQTAYNAQTSNQQLVYRPSCFVTGVGMIWFVGAVLAAGLAWVVRNWSKS